MRKQIVWTILGLAAILAATYWLRRPIPPAAPVTIPVAAYAPGTVRLDHGLWVARQPGGEFYVFLDRDPHKGERLNWVVSHRMFEQAAVYRIDGSCFEGPCDSSPGGGLFRVKSHLEGDNLVVYPDQFISGGFHPEPAWLSALKHFFTKPKPHAPY